MAQRRLNLSTKVPAAGHLNRSLLYCPHIHAYLHPSSHSGPHSRCPSLASAVQHVTTCRACGSGALRRPAFSFFDCSVPPWRRFYLGQLKPTLVIEPWSARTHHLPLRRLAPVSRSVGLSPTLSLPFSLALPALPCSFSPVAPLFSFPTVLYPVSLSLCFSLPLSRAQKGGSGCSVHLYPPRGSNHPPRDRRGVVYPLGHDDGLSAPWHHALHSSSPYCHPLSCVSSFAWGFVQQCVEEPHSVPGYRVRLPEERSLEQSQEVRSACQPHMHAIARSAYRGGHRSVSFCRRTVEDRLPLDLLGRHWTCMFARAWVFRVQLIWTITE